MHARRCSAPSPCSAQAKASLSRASPFRPGAAPFRRRRREAWFNIVEKELGITIKEDTTSGVADIRAQVASGRPTWDLSTQGAHTCGILEKEGKLEKLDAGHRQRRRRAEGPEDRLLDLADRLFHRHRLAHEGLRRQEASRLGSLLGHQELPGSALHARHPIYNLEAALIADGVPMDKLYPIDVDRAFKKLEELKPHVLVWWNSGAQSAQILQDGEVDMVGAWNGRIQAAMKEKEGQGRPARHHLRPADARLRLLAHPQRRAEQGSRHEGHRHHDAPRRARPSRNTSTTRQRTSPPSRPA